MRLVRKSFLVRMVGLIPRGLLRASLRTLPGSSRRWGPPRRFAEMRTLARRGGAEWHQAYPALSAAYPRPRALSCDEPRLRHFGPVAWAPSGAACVPAGRLLSEHAFAIAPPDVFLVDSAWNEGRPVQEAIVIRGTGRIERRAGTALNLASTWAGINYAHFLLDSLPRLHLFERAGGRIEDVDWIILPGFPSPAARRHAAALGLPAEKIIHPRRAPQLEFDRVWQPSYPCVDRARRYPPWVADFCRSRLHVAAAPSGRRLFLARRTRWRRLVNESELEPLLREYGFEIVDPGSLSNAPEQLAGAEAVVAPHGAGMADIVFCRPGTPVVEILPPNWLWPYYHSLACAARLTYYAVIGDRTAGPGRDQNEFRISPDKLRRILEASLRDADVGKCAT